MAFIGNIVVGVIANTQKAVKNVRAFRKETSLMTKATKGALRPMGKFAAGFAGLVGVAGALAVNHLKKSAENIDKIAKTSQKLGIPTDRLIGLHHAAEQTGVSTDTANMAIQRMTRRVSEAAKGTGEAVKALDELNVDVEMLAKLRPDQQMHVLADAMKRVENQSDRVRLAMKLFDSEGVELVNTLKLGSKGLQQMHDDAERLGMLFSNEEAARVEKFNDQLDRLKKSFGGLGQRLVIDLAPRAAELIEGFLLTDEQRRAPARADEGITRRFNAARRLQQRQALGMVANDTQLAAAREGLRRIQRRDQIADSAQKGLLKAGNTLLNVAKFNRDAFLPTIGDLKETSKGLRKAVLDEAIRQTFLPRQAVKSDPTAKPKETDRRQLNTAIESGSSEAFVALRANLRSSKQADLQKRQLDEQVETNRHLEMIANRQQPERRLPL